MQALEPDNEAPHFTLLQFFTGLFGNGAIGHRPRLQAIEHAFDAKIDAGDLRL